MSSLLEALFSRGRVVDLILVVMALEAAWLLSRRRRRWSVLDLALALGPGVCLLLALRASLVGADSRWIALALAASFPIHLIDLQRRGTRR